MRVYCLYSLMMHTPLFGIPLNGSPLSSMEHLYPVGHGKGDSPSIWTDVLQVSSEIKKQNQ